MLRLFKGQMDPMSMTWMIWDFKLCQIKSSVLGGIRLHLWGWELLLDGEGVLGCRKEGCVQHYNPTGSPHERVTKDGNEELCTVYHTQTPGIFLKILGRNHTQCQK